MLRLAVATVTWSPWFATVSAASQTVSIPRSAARARSAASVRYCGRRSASVW